MNIRRAVALLVVAVVGFAGPRFAAAQEVEFPGVEKAMPAEEFEGAGLSKLTAEERARLDDFIRSYVTKSNEKAATVAVDQAVKERGVKEPVVIQSNIVGVFTGYTGRSSFRLANGQVWRQSQQVERTYPKIDSPPVLLTKGQWGWRMYIAGGGDIRVSKAP